MASSGKIGAIYTSIGWASSRLSPPVRTRHPQRRNGLSNNNASMVAGGIRSGVVQRHRVSTRGTKCRGRVIGRQSRLCAATPPPEDRGRRRLQSTRRNLTLRPRPQCCAPSTRPVRPEVRFLVVPWKQSPRVPELASGYRRTLPVFERHRVTPVMTTAMALPSISELRSRWTALTRLNPGPTSTRRGIRTPVRPAPGCHSPPPVLPLEEGRDCRPGCRGSSHRRVGRRHRSTGDYGSS